MKTVRQFMLDKFPTDKHFDCPVPKDIWPLFDEYAAQFKPKWISVEEFEGEIGQMVLVKGIMRSELGDSSEPSTGLVNWKNKDYSECSDCCYYAMWYTNITEVFIIPKTV